MDDIRAQIQHLASQQAQRDQQAQRIAELDQQVHSLLTVGKSAYTQAVAELLQALVALGDAAGTTAELRERLGFARTELVPLYPLLTSQARLLTILAEEVTRLQREVAALKASQHESPSDAP